MHLNCEFIIVPRIVLNDNNLSQTDKLLFGLIVSLTFKKHYCFASNKYLSKIINVSVRTITNSLSTLKSENYIFIKYEDKKRKIFLNNEKVLQNSSSKNAKNCEDSIEDNCYHNINTKYKNNIKVPKWFTNNDLIKEEKASKEEIEELERKLKNVIRKDDDI